MRVRALPPSFDEEYARWCGENTFCDLFDWRLHDRGETCSGMPEVEITLAKATLRLCREHAGYLAKQVRECIEMADAADLFRKPT